MDGSLIERAIDLAGGSEAKLAKAIGLSQPLINKARKSGHAGPKLAIAIHQFTKGEVSASDLRPDLWQAPENVPIALDDSPLIKSAEATE
jgi:DNA-binding transcriptional regulator YdaS (Cro superfamily)